MAIYPDGANQAIYKTAETYSDVLEWLRAQYAKGIESGEFRNASLLTMSNFSIYFFGMYYKWGSPKASLIGRWTCFLLSCAFSTYNIFYTRSNNYCHGFLYGYSQFWAILYGYVFLICNDVQRDMKRIEYRIVEEDEDVPTSELKGAAKEEIKVLKDITNKQPSSGLSRVNIKSDGLATKENNNGSATMVVEDKADTTETIKANATSTGAKKWTSNRRYYWQGHPDNLAHRFFWVADLYFSMRGVGWTFRSNKIYGPLPARILRDVDPKKAKGIDLSRADEIDNELTPGQWLRKSTYQYLKILLAFDFCMHVAKGYDRFFWGDLTADTPDFIKYLGFSPNVAYFMATTFRYFFSGFCVCVGLQLGFSTMRGLLLLWAYFSPRSFRTPMDESWMFPAFNGPFFYNVCFGGVNGLWSRFWHNLFRYAFTMPIRNIIQNWPRDGPFLVEFLTVTTFAWSGIIHAAGAVTMTGPAYPISKTFAYFFWQGLFIIIQHHCSSVARRLKVPLFLRALGNILMATIVTFSTGQLFISDVASGGVWLIESIPFSPLTLAGWKIPGDTKGAYRWGDIKVFRLWSGEKWYQKGLIFV